MILVYGHKNPDTDAICSAIAYANLKNIIGEEAKPIRIGNLNEETKFVLKYFSKEAPEFLDNIANQKVILVDHNERSQTADGFEEAKVLEVIDHHRVANFNVSDPLYMRVEAVGCTATILLDLYNEKNVKIDKDIAGLMLSAIISDTLLFKSPTCTEKDIKAAKVLADITNVELEKYGLEMLKAGTNLSSKTEEELLNMDMKIFQVDDVKLSVAQVNSVNESEMLERKEKLMLEMKKLMEKENLSLALFIITNILTNDSVAIVLGDNLEVVEKAFNSKIENDLILLKGVVSRKKQVIPPLTDAIKSN